MARIVVADDDVDIRRLVAFRLGRSGHDMVQWADGAAALEACQEQRPDLLILDVMMPGMSGLDVARIVRRDASFSGVPIIVLTARAQEADIEHAFDSGADDYVTKPFSPRELVLRVDAVLARGRHE